LKGCALPPGIVDGLGISGAEEISMKRTRSRTITIAALALLALTIAWERPLSAKTSCEPVPSGNLCTAEVDFGQFAQTAFMQQAMSQWCWAASISMIFSFYGHHVGQDRIVAEAYGSIANVPAPGIVVASQLNRTWIDDDRRAFSAQLTGAFDVAAGVNTLDNARLVAELNADHPVLIGTASHAMVLTKFQYLVTPFGSQPQRMGVFDPWPGRGARDLTVAESTPAPLGGQLMFLATARVTDLAGSTGAAGSGGPVNSAGAAGTTGSGQAGAGVAGGAGTSGRPVTGQQGGAGASAEPAQPGTSGCTSAGGSVPGRGAGVYVGLAIGFLGLVRSMRRRSTSRR
jgi:hypothetical protein